MVGGEYLDELERYNDDRKDHAAAQRENSELALDADGRPSGRIEVGGCATRCGVPGETARYSGFSVTRFGINGSAPFYRDRTIARPSPLNGEGRG